MGVKGDNLGINSGLLLPSFILNYMVIRVKERSLNKEKRTVKKGEMSETKRRTKRKAEALSNSLLDNNSSVEVGYGLCYFIVNS